MRRSPLVRMTLLALLASPAAALAQTPPAPSPAPAAAPTPIPFPQALERAANDLFSKAQLD